MAGNASVPSPRSFRLPPGSAAWIPPLLAALCLVCSSCAGTAPDTGAEAKWVGTWGTAQQLVEPGNHPPPPGLSNNTLRQIVRVSIGGDSLRLRLSNEFGSGPVTFQAVNIALSAGGGAITPGTDRNLTFAGVPDVTVPPGRVVTSDPIGFVLQPRVDVAVTIHYGVTPPEITGHPGSRTTSYLLSGNGSRDVKFAGAVTTDHWYNISAIDVLAPPVAACVAILGNSITDGRGSTTNMQNRWPDILSESLLRDSSTRHIGVINAGIGGNCVLSGGLGPTGMSRFDRDVLDQSGVRWAVVCEGVNDVGRVTSPDAARATAGRLIEAYRQMIARAHAKKVRIYGATILPFNGHSYYNQYSELCRSTVNAWIRAGGNFDACIDFDRVLRNPLDTTRLMSTYQNDGLHPDAAGYRAMGESVDHQLFADRELVAHLRRRRNILHD